MVAVASGELAGASGELAGARFYDDAAHDWQRHRVVCSR